MSTPFTAHHPLLEVAGDREVGSNERDDVGTLQVHAENDALRLFLGLCSSVECVQPRQVGEKTKGQTSRQRRKTTALVYVYTLS